MSDRPDIVYERSAKSTALGEDVPAVSDAITGSTIQSRPGSSTTPNYNDVILMAHTITLIPGDGIGPEVTRAVVKILEASSVSIEWDTHDAGIVAVERRCKPLPDALIDSIRRNKVALKGPVTTPVGEGFTSVNVGLRKALDLYSNLRPVWNLPGVAAKFSNVDLVIVRENTEDLYAGLEHQIIPGVVESL